MHGTWWDVVSPVVRSHIAQGGFDATNATESRSLSQNPVCGEARTSRPVADDGRYNLTLLGFLETTGSFDPQVYDVLDA